MPQHGSASYETGNALGRTTLHRRRYAPIKQKSIWPDRGSGLGFVAVGQNFTITEKTMISINTVGTSFIMR